MPGKSLALLPLLAAFLSSPAWSHEGHGLAGAHWHATDTLGLLLVGGIAALLVWLLRGR
ncbi:hypothetical protein [Ramlibacter sp.]|uniref:hypothetical protein n=1 Tax=Ramlibacter sp. TaxID=1917967 RepID=UPI002D6E6B2C|nr:hypothetical protein [Ramlibacter sp.]HYD77811.1 hypothetical protein [Ramlibacter sp.]